MTEYAYYALTGGMDLATPALTIKDGSAIEAVNFEPGISGGFRRIAGYERFDGRKRPSDATFYRATVDDPSGLSVGDTLTGPDGTGHIIEMKGDQVFITALTGEFAEGDAVNGTVLTSDFVERDALTQLEEQEILYLAAEYYRGLIQAVPGTGPIRGVMVHRDTVFAWRDSGSACKVYKATSTGWSELILGRTIRFNTGTSAIAAGDLITNGTATALVKNVKLITGTWSGGNAVGYITVTSVSGTFAVGNDLKVGTTQKAKVAEAPRQVSFSAGGRVEMISYNFMGSESGFKVFGCNGIDPAFEIDENDVVTPLFSKATQDKPTFITAYRNRLFLGFDNGSVQFSVVGTPHSYEVSLGAGEIGVGSRITGLLPQPGGLIITSNRQTFILEGDNLQNFNLQVASDSTGAAAYTLQSLSRIYALDDRGIISLDRTQAFGNFESATLSRRIQKIVDAKRSKVIASSVVRYSNQYRLYFSDGTCLATYPLATEKTMSFHATVLEYPNPVTCIVNNEDLSGDERIMFGSTDGFVYEDHRGTSFDGQPIEAWVRLSFNHFKSPRVRKRWRKAVIELDGDGHIEMQVTPDISYSSPYVAPSMTQDAIATGGGGYWDTDSWEQFTWASQVVSTAEIKLFGTGLNLGLLMYTHSELINPFTLQSMIIHFDKRRLER